MPGDNAELYQEHASKRAEYSAKVLDSDSSKIIVMAGPGTGKSFLFQQLAKKYIADGKDNILVLSFINELVKDLAVDMHGLAEVSTLHSFAAKELRFEQTIYMGLLDVIQDDYKIEREETVEFDTVLHNMDEGDPSVIEYLRKRRDYYSAIDPSSMIYELVKHFKSDESNIPTYDLILVDEYQDFNLLEIELISLLGTKSNILIAGDDDQSLYSFKHSVPKNIRDKHSAGEFTAFELPYCSRSTKVIIDSFHDIVNKAKADGHLSDRVEKQYMYFPSEDKDRISSVYPTIDIRRNTQQVQNAFYIDQHIQKIFETEPKFEVLIICPLKKQLSSLGAMLRKKGYNNISGDDKPTEDSVHLNEGLRLLVQNMGSNLGWRLCAQALMTTQDFEQLIINSAACDHPFNTLVPSQTSTQIRKLRAAAVKLNKNQSLDDSQKELLFSKLGIDVTQTAESEARGRIFTNKSNKVHHGIKIKLTTILGSKGLSYDYVFMVNFDDRYLIPDGVNDEAVNKFLVALTRSKKKITVFTSEASDPTFVSWISEGNKQQIR